jgi:chorismate mutase
MLKKHRNEIDIIDAQIIDLFAKRFKVVEKVWEFKKDKNMDALQS